MLPTKEIVVIGGCAGGMSAAAQARRFDPEANITVFEKGRFISYASCGIPYFISGDVPSWDKLVLYTPERFSQERRINVLTEHLVTKINVGERTVDVSDLRGGKEFKKLFTSLIIATGASPFLPPLTGYDLEGVFTVRGIEEAINLKRYIEENKPRQAVIAGGGYIGMEMAEALNKIGMEVAIVEAEERLLPHLDKEISTLVMEECIAKGVKLFLGEKVLAIEGDKRVRELITTNRGLPCDLLILSLGARPNVSLAKEANIPLGATGAIRVKSDQETEIPGILAAGDCCETKNIVTGKPFWLPLGTIANKQGRIAGQNAVGKERAFFPGAVGTQVVKVFDLEVASTGLSEHQAKKEGFEVASVVVRSPSNASYYPGAETITAKMIMDERSRRILGMEMVGRKGVAKRIDSAAVALHLHLTVDEVAWLDLSYAPPFAPVWDVLLHAAQSLSAKTRR